LHNAICNKEFIDKSQEELEFVQNSFDSDNDGDAELVVQQNSSYLPCSRWGKAAGMTEARQIFKEDLVTSLLICGFCGRGAFLSGADRCFVMQFTLYEFFRTLPPSHMIQTTVLKSDLPLSSQSPCANHSVVT
jgi:hypothetical protein